MPTILAVVEIKGGRKMAQKARRRPKLVKVEEHWRRKPKKK
tara:strand:- start:266 stop:388 length:123 start_codon:yes stop_codon:yes gene_type:complete